MPTRAEIIKQTAAEIIVLFEQEQLDENILELTLNCMAVELEQAEFGRNHETMQKALAGR